MEVARERAQVAADVLVGWARRKKVEVVGQKTHLVLSQNHHDAIGCATSW